MRTALALLLAGWGFSLLISLPLNASWIRQTYTKTALSMIFLEIVFLLPVWIYLKRKRTDLSLKGVFRLYPVPSVAWPGILVFGAGVTLLADALDRILALWLEIPEEYISLLQSLQWSSAAEAAVMIFAVVVVAAVVEEMIFRGMLIQSMEKSFNKPAPALLFSSLFFALVHSLPWAFIQIFLLGIVLGFLSIVFRSVWPAVLLHGMNNLFSIVLLNMEKEPSWYISGGRVRNIWIVIAGILVWRGVVLIRPWIRLSVKNHSENYDEV